MDGALAPTAALENPHLRLLRRNTRFHQPLFVPPGQRSRSCRPRLGRSNVRPNGARAAGNRRALSEPDEHDSGEDTERETDQELVNAVAYERKARPEDDRDHGNESVADRGTEQRKGRRREGSEGDVQRELDPTSEETGEEKKGRHDEHAAHEKRLRVPEKEPPERGNQTGESDHEQHRPFGGFRGVDVRPSPAANLTVHEDRNWNDDSDGDEEHRLDGVAGRLA